MKLAISVIVVLLAIAGVGYWVMQRGNGNANTTAALSTYTVKRGDLKVMVQAQGSVASNRDVDIKCKVSGNILELPHKDVSAEVQAGELLVRLDTNDEVRALESAKAVVTADRARLEEAKINWNVAKLNLETTTSRTQADLKSAKAKAGDAEAKAERTKQLYDAKLASKEDLETAQTTAAQADADVQNAQAAVDELAQQAKTIDVKEQEIHSMEAQLTQDQAKQETAELNLTYCNVKAPDAVPNDPDPPHWVISKMTAGVALGYLVQSGSSGASGGTTIMTLSDLSHVYVLATVNEADMGDLKERFDTGADLRCTIVPAAYKNSNEVFEGKVVRIATLGVANNNVVTFEVKVEVTSPNFRKLLPNMTADVNITVDERRNAVLIPVAAVNPKERVSRKEGAATQKGGRGDSAAGTEPAAQAASAEGEGAATMPAATGPATRRGGGRRGGQAGGQGGNGGRGAREDRPKEPDTVNVLKADGSIEKREVVLGISDDVNYEVVSGLSEGEVLQYNKAAADSRWKNQNGQGGGRGGPGGMMRGMGR